MPKENARSLALDRRIAQTLLDAANNGLERPVRRSAAAAEVLEVRLRHSATEYSVHLLIGCER